MIIATILLMSGALYGAERLLEYWDARSADGARALALPTDQVEEGETALAPREISDEEQEINESFLFSAGCFGLTVSGALFCPPLGLIGGGLLLYVARSMFRRAYDAIFVEHRLRASILDAGAIVAFFVIGLYVVSTMSAMVYFIGRKLLFKIEDRSRAKLISIFGEQQRTVWLLRDGVETEIPLETLRQGDVIVVTAGQIVPVDGVVRAGTAAIDQRALTGESQPAERGPGEQVLASTLVISGRLQIEVERTGESTMVAQLVRVLNQTADYRAEIEARSERLGDQSVLPLLGLSGLALATVGSAGAVAVLASNFTENLRVAGPMSMLNFLNRASRRGILIKDGRALERLLDVDSLVFDKTGTLTDEQPYVGQPYPCADLEEDELLAYAAAVEARQSHPIARAILKRAAERALVLPALVHAHYEAGYGIAAQIEGRYVLVGSDRYMRASMIPIPDEIVARQAAAHAQGDSLVYVAVDGHLAGALELRPTLRPEIRDVIAALQQRGLSLCIMSGDHEAPTRELAAELHVDRYFSEVLPTGKSTRVQQMQAEGHTVCFIGDGINDAIALKTASASISLRGATTAATDTAQIVMMDGTLRQLPALFELADEYGKNIRTSLYAIFGAAVVSVGGVFFLGFGVLASIVLYNVSLALAVGNAMRPALRKDRPADLPAKD